MKISINKMKKWPFLILAILVISGCITINQQNPQNTPITQPTNIQPSVQPTNQPYVQPTNQPYVQPTNQPYVQPTTTILQPNFTLIINYSAPENYSKFIDNTTKESISDIDGDGISDYDEINGYTFNGIVYYTDPLQKSTDFDPYDDRKEITTINMNPTVKSPGRNPLVPSYPDLNVDVEQIDVNTLTKITSTSTKEMGWAWSMSTTTTDTTRENWGTNVETYLPAKFWNSYVKLNLYYDYTRTYTTMSTQSNSGWGREEWSKATAIDLDKAARLKFHLKINNDGTDTAKNVKLRFNVKIGNKVISTIKTDEITDRIDPDIESPENVIEKDESGYNDITVTFNELRSIELGAPITIEILEINAQVPYEIERYDDWNDYKAGIDRTSAKIVLDDGTKVKEYRVFSGIRYPAQGPPYYFMNITVEDAINYALGLENKSDGAYINGEKVDNWRFGFDDQSFSYVNNYIVNIGPLLKIPIRQGMTILLKPPDKIPPKIYWATIEDRLIEVSVTDNEMIGNVTAHIKIGGTYQDIALQKNNGTIYSTTLSDNASELENAYIMADDGIQNTKIGITIISMIPETPTPKFIDLSSYVNHDNISDFGKGYENLPLNDIVVSKYSQIPFKVYTNGSNSIIIIGNYLNGIPDSIDIKFNDYASTIYFFGHIQAGIPSNEIVGWYKIRYDDGTILEIDLDNRPDSLNYNIDDQCCNWINRNTTNAIVAWEDLNQTEKVALLREFKWNNPYPTKKINSIEFGANTDSSKSPMLFGITYI